MLFSGCTTRDRSDDPSHHKWTLYHGATNHSVMDIMLMMIMVMMMIVIMIMVMMMIMITD